MGLEDNPFLLGWRKLFRGADEFDKNAGSGLRSGIREIGDRCSIGNPPSSSGMLNRTTDET